jgi:hypothetical protein
MGVDVSDFIKECPTSAFNDRQRQVDSTHTPPRGEAPWRVVQADVVFLEPAASGYDCAVVFIDRYTRRPRIFPARKSMTSKDFLNIVMFGMLKEVGWPEVLITDRGSILTSEIMQKFYKATGISHVAADAHMHTAVGCCERFNASLRAMARAAYFDSAFQWDVWLPLIELFYAARPQAGLAGYSPFFLLDTGRSPRLPWDLMYSPRPPGTAAPALEVLEKRISQLHRAWRATQSELDQSERQCEAASAAKHRAPPVFKVGDRVLILRPPGLRGSKMEFPHFGPFVVVEVLERDRYRLTDPHGRALGKHDVFHGRRLKRMPALSRDVIIDSKARASNMVRMGRAGPAGGHQDRRLSMSSRCRFHSWERLLECDSYRSANLIHMVRMPSPPPAVAYCVPVSGLRAKWTAPRRARVRPPTTGTEVVRSPCPLDPI